MAEIPVVDNEQRAEGFVAYLVDAVLASPRTQAQIGTLVRTVLVALGSGWAATHGDGINLLVGVLLAVVAGVWGVYQKFRVDRKIRKLQEVGE